MTPDVNVLVAASRSDHVHHEAAYSWLEGALQACNTGSTLKLLPMVVARYLRLVTNPKVFRNETPPLAAVAFIDALLAAPGVSIPSIGDEWPLLRELCVDKRLSANSIPDAWLAAAVLQLDEHLATFDVDFKKLLRRERVTLLTP